MSFTAEQLGTIVGELKKLEANLDLSNEQKLKLSAFLAEAHEKVAQYKLQNPKATKVDIFNRVAANRTALRERLVKFLSPEQLTKWDARVAGMKELFGQKLAAW